MTTHSGNRRRILIIEDDNELFTVLERSARQHCRDLVVDWASDLRTARACLKRTRYDAVIADYVLGPHERGTAVCTPCLRNNAQTRFAIMSATPLAELMDRITDPNLPLLPKPFTPFEFAHFVESLLERPERHSDLDDPEETGSLALAYA